MMTIRVMGGNRRSHNLLLIIVFASLFGVQASQDDEGSDTSCTNSDGEVIPHGQEFIPDFNDPCTICVCDKRFPISCRTTACSPPPGCKQTTPIPRKCCQFICEGNNSLPPSDDSNNTKEGGPTPDEDNITNLSLRLVASTVTSFLVLALLLFMVHRLRQRRLMLAMRRQCLDFPLPSDSFEAHARQQRGDEDDADHYIPAAFLHIECPPYEDPPPPYSPPKPVHILPEDSPPPYQELENDTSSDLDANANVSNNNNNNDRSCTQHRQDGDLNSGTNPARSDRQDAIQSSSSTVQEVSDTLHAASDCGTVGGRGTSASQNRENETELKVISRRESCPFERGGVPFRQDYSLFSAGAARNEGSGACSQAVLRGTSGEVSASHLPRPRASDASAGAGGRGGGRGARKTGRSCSFSFTHSPDKDSAMCGIALAPMSQSYHATTADSGVQTHGSYTASLSRHRARAANTGVDGAKGTVKEEVGGVCEQRMVTKPMVKCDVATQQSHRQLQEELRRNLPPAFVGENHDAQGSGSVSQGSEHVSCRGAGAHSSAADSRSGNTRGSSAIDPETRAGKSSPASPEPDSGDVGAPLPRSQSVNSTFSVCSETGELHIKKGAGGADSSVLQSDCQYPDHGVPGMSLPLAASQPPQGMACIDNPSTLPNYIFPGSSSPFSVAGTPHNASGLIGQVKLSATGSSRRPVPAPPSQELRTGVSATGGRSHSAKAKHKKIHFVPLEKSKTFKKDKKDKSKASKKGELELDTHHHDGGPRASVLSSNPHSAVTEDSSQPRIHQPKLTEMVRGSRLPPSTQSVKEYGFLDHCPSSSLQGEKQRDSNAKNADVGKDSRGSGTNSNTVRFAPSPYHSLPHKSHAYSSGSSHHTSGHRRQLSHGDRLSHTNSSRTKTKARPLSSGLVVEPGRDPSDLATALPQTSVPRRRGKTVHMKKSRQSYPTPDSGGGGGGGGSGERKANCVDLGFVEPSQDSCRMMGADSEVAAHTLPSKRRALDKGGDSAGLVSVGVSGQTHMSSYV